MGYNLPPELISTIMTYNKPYQSRQLSKQIIEASKKNQKLINI